MRPDIRPAVLISNEREPGTVRLHADDAWVGWKLASREEPFVSWRDEETGARTDYAVYRGLRAVTRKPER